MSEISNSTVAQKKRASNDPGWEFGELVDVDDKNIVRCILCGHMCKGGIQRLKQHIAGQKGNVKSCTRVKPEDRKRMLEHMLEKKLVKTNKEITEQRMRDEIHMEYEELETRESLGKKRPKTVGPMDSFTVVDPKVSIKEGKKMIQSSLKDKLCKEKRDKTCAWICKWFYEAGVPFHASSLPSFKYMMEAVGQYGPGIKTPSEYEMAGPFLKRAVEETNDSLSSHREAWKSTGCSIMTDAWSDKKNRSIMNLCIHCSLGTSFLRAIDASSESHTADYIYGLVDSCIIEVGEENVVQVVTDNALANMAAAKKLEKNRPNIFWTSCAAHTMDLVLEGIGNTFFKKTISRARNLTVFIYTHHLTLSLMRQEAQGEIVRPGVTRFATSFLTLQSLLEKRGKLHNMFSSKRWMTSKLHKTSSGKKAYATVYAESFWSEVERAIKVFAPLVRVLRVADRDIKPSMGFIYAALEDAKNEIKSVCRHIEKNYKPYLDIIEAKTKGRMDSNLHLAGYFLNPVYFILTPN